MGGTRGENPDRQKKPEWHPPFDLKYSVGCGWHWAGSRLQ